MWLLNQWGFTDTVENKHDPTVLLVRAWERGSLEAFCAYGEIDVARIFTDMPSDIPYRLEVSREEYAYALTNMTYDITYPKFKPALASNRGNKFSNLVHRWWGDFRSLLMSAADHRANQRAFERYAEANRNNPDRSWMSRNIDAAMPAWAKDPAPTESVQETYTYDEYVNEFGHAPGDPDLPYQLRKEVEEAIAVNPTEEDIEAMSDAEYEAYVARKLRDLETA